MRHLLRTPWSSGKQVKFGRELKLHKYLMLPLVAAGRIGAHSCCRGDGRNSFAIVGSTSYRAQTGDIYDHNGRSVGERPTWNTYHNLPSRPTPSSNIIHNQTATKLAIIHQGGALHQRHKWQLHPTGSSVRLASTLPYSLDLRQRFMATPVSPTRQRRHARVRVTKESHPSGNG